MNPEVPSDAPAGAVPVSGVAVPSSPPSCTRGVVVVILVVGYFVLIRWSRSISFSRAQGIPKYKIGLEGGKDGRVGLYIAYP